MLRFAKFIFLSALLIQCIANAQTKSDGAEPPYLFPLKPGEDVSLAGTMGELRSTHIHSGIDIRTYNQIGIPVLATMDGYISRISIGPGGFGNALYVTHTNGETSVYGHLDHFNKTLQSYATQERYKKKSSDVSLFPEARQFSVKRGDTIAFSGNTGSSAGPHLHFEIRDKNNMALNPLKVGFKEIRDHLPPVAEKIALKTMDPSSRINDQFGRTEFHVLSSGNVHTIASPILAYGNIGIELAGFDRLDLTPQYRCGISVIQLKVDGELKYSQSIDKIDFGNTRGSYVHMDYAALESIGSRFMKVFIDDGNPLNHYDRSLGNGIVHVENSEVKVEVILEDVFGNSSTVTFSLMPSPPPSKVFEVNLTKKEKASIPVFSIQDNTLLLKSSACADELHKVWAYSESNREERTPDYSDDEYDVYLFDLRTQIPDSIVTCNGVVKPGIRARIFPSTSYTFYSDNMNINFAKSAAFDTVYLQTDYTLSPSGRELFSIGPASVPLNNGMTVSLKFQKAYNTSDKKIGLYSVNGNSYSWLSSQWQNGQVKFTTRQMGTFTLLSDSIAPVIRPIFVDALSARFKITDNLSGIQSFQATINGQWLLMDYDSKTNSIWSIPPTPGQHLKGLLEVKVTDHAGNQKVFTKNIP